MACVDEDSSKKSVSVAELFFTFAPLGTQAAV